MMSVDAVCDERTVLTLKLAVATDTVSLAYQLYVSSKKRKDTNLGTFNNALADARAAARSATVALRRHIEEHECIHRIPGVG